jgi:putative oxidoreductase
MMITLKTGDDSYQAAIPVNRPIIISIAPKGTWLIRILIGWDFLSEGIQKFLFPQSVGVGRFAKIGIPAASLSAPLLGAVEIVFGALIIVGLHGYRRYRY